MPRGDLDPGIARQHPEHLEANRLDRLNDFTGVAIRSGLVDDHSAEPNVGVKGVEPVHDCSRGT